ncbi:NAD(+) synthase, partial [Candidatus Saccharibacteria bacterium]|nr:NAD(+) synthase [Candidatus Saccharibacteria bacterium]NIV04589.1 NAD(+) synthase [Calditrichia bacterium]NIV73203.1 NAD(+) synthase [Calditrichia bacterium]NIW00568.1 NAD(+) synthase [Candidatus Saccharibacteria bacterium]NIW80926.1 NAD(+) synthase [Calditrichia bacterium]
MLIADLHPDNVFSSRLHDPRRRKEKLFVPAGKVIEQIELSGQEKKQKKAITDPEIVPHPETTEEVYQALKLGLADYVAKNGFSKVALGLSGGVDSALVCMIAADALGAENVTAIILPSQYTRQSSLDDARLLAQNVGVESREISIAQIYDRYLEELKPLFADRESDITEENLQ